MGRLKPRSGAAIGALSLDQIWYLKNYIHVGMPSGAPENPFGSIEAAEKAWRAHRSEILANKFPGQSPLSGELEFDARYESEREETRRRLKERERQRALAEGVL